MAHLRKPVVLLIVLVITLSGCQWLGKAKTDDIPVDELGREKSALFAKIDKKYESPKAHYELGKLYYNDGLWDKAEWEFNIVLGFDPVHRRAQAALVKTLIADGGGILYESSIYFCVGIASFGQGFSAGTFGRLCGRLLSTGTWSCSEFGCVA